MSREQVARLGFAETPDRVWWSYGDQEFSLRQDPGQVYLEKPVISCRSPIGSLRDESFRAARLISEKQKKPVILYSGGIDSEAILLSFHLQKLPFEVVILDYVGVNYDEADRAMAFCQKLGVSARFLKIDVKDFWENELEAMAKQVHCVSPQVAALCKGISLIDGYVIIGDGDSSLVRAGSSFYEMKSERWAAARWMLLHGKEGCPRFYQYTAELEASIYFEPLVEQFVEEQMWHFLDFRKIRYLKPFIFHQNFGCRLREKKTGFERVEEGEIYQGYKAKLIELIGLPQEISWTYQNARHWALSPHGPTKWVSLEEESPYPRLDTEALSQIGSGIHWQWIE